MTIILFDTSIGSRQLYPFSLVRPVASIRHGLFSAQEWYAQYSGKEVRSLIWGEKQEIEAGSGTFIFIDSSIVPTDHLLEKALGLSDGELLEDEQGIVAFCSTKFFDPASLPLFFKKTYRIEGVERITHPMDFVKTNAQKIIRDLEKVPKSGLQTPDPASNRIFGSHPVWVEPGAKVQGCLFNTEDGPVYVGKNALLMEGSCFRGPIAICEGAVVKMGSQIYGGTTIGRFTIAGGEIKNTILSDYSNKAHHGYLGDSLIGEWCNLGAGTTNSNVKNNAGKILMWSGATQALVLVGNKAGMVMGDFSKTAINTTINSGTTFGIGCSIHLDLGSAKHIPSFSWGPGETYDLNRLTRDIRQWCSWKQFEPSAEKLERLAVVYQSHKPL